MGYDLQITRKEFWADESGPVISAAEWLAVVAGDSTLRIDAGNGAYFAVWSAEGADTDWFDFDEGGGYLFSSNPTDAGVDKMIEIAASLGAVVQGQDGEIYTANWREE